MSAMETREGAESGSNRRIGNRYNPPQPFRRAC